MGFVRFIMIVIGLGLIGTGVGAVALTPKWEPLLRAKMETELGSVLGTEVTIGAVHPSWLEGALALEKVTIKNPPNFKDGPAAECDRVLIQPEFLTVFSKSPTIANLTLEGAALKLRYKPGETSNLGYFKKQANTVAQSTPTTDSGVVVKEVHVSDAKFDLTPNPRFDLDFEHVLASADGKSVAAAASTAKTFVTLFNQVLEKGAAAQGIVQPLVDLLKLEAASNATVPPAPPAGAPADPSAKPPVILDIPAI